MNRLDWDYITSSIPDNGEYLEYEDSHDYMTYIFVRSKRNHIYALMTYKYTVRGKIYHEAIILECLNNKGKIAFRDPKNKKRISDRYFSNWFMEQLL